MIKCVWKIGKMFVSWFVIVIVLDAIVCDWSWVSEILIKHQHNPLSLHILQETPDSPSLGRGALIRRIRQPSLLP